MIYAHAGLLAPQTLLHSLIQPGDIVCSALTVHHHKNVNQLTHTTGASGSFADFCIHKGTSGNKIFKKKCQNQVYFPVHTAQLEIIHR